MLQGDSYKVPVEILLDDLPLDVDTVEDIEISISTLKKTLKNGEVESSDGLFLFPLTQQETFRLHPSNNEVQVRVLFKTGDVIGTKAGNMHNDRSLSKVVLE